MEEGTPPDGGDGREDVVGRALSDLRRELHARTRAAEEAAADIDVFELFDELRKRANRFGMSERSGEVDEFGMETESIAAARPLLDFLSHRYWRIEVHGRDALPDAGPALFVANRSGVLPYDGVMIAHELARGHAAQERPRFLVADWLITLPFMQSRLARLGGVRACRENAERLLRSGHSVVTFPEGQKGAAKIFADRYRLQRFGRGGVVRTAIEAGVPLVPVAVVGAEEAHPVLFKTHTLARAVGLPFLPVTPTFPLLGPLGALPLPSKWSIRFGPPLTPGDLAPGAADDALRVSQVTEELRAQIQQMLDLDRRAREGVFS